MRRLYIKMSAILIFNVFLNTYAMDYERCLKKIWSDFNQQDLKLSNWRPKLYHANQSARTFITEFNDLSPVYRKKQRKQIIASMQEVRETIIKEKAELNRISIKGLTIYDDLYNRFYRGSEPGTYIIKGKSGVNVLFEAEGESVKLVDKILSLEDSYNSPSSRIEAQAKFEKLLSLVIKSHERSIQVLSRNIKLLGQTKAKPQSFKDKLLSFFGAKKAEKSPDNIKRFIEVNKQDLDLDRYFMREAKGKINETYKSNALSARGYFESVVLKSQGNLKFPEFVTLNNKMHRISAIGETQKTPYKVMRKKSNGEEVLEYSTDEIDAGMVISPINANNRNFSSRPKMDNYADSIIRNILGLGEGRSQLIHVKGVSENKLPSNFVRTHYYPKREYVINYFKSAHKQFNEILNLPLGDPDKALRLIADYYHTMINARPYEQINNSLFMNQVNSLLKLKGLKPMSHGYLDHLAHRMSYQDFREAFKLHYNNELPLPSQ